jgi:hypothetical protein
MGAFVKVTAAYFIGRAHTMPRIIDQNGQKFSARAISIAGKRQLANDL